MKRFLPLIFATALFAGCDAITQLTDLIDFYQPDDQEAARLVAFESEDDLVGYVREQVMAQSAVSARDLFFGEGEVLQNINEDAADTAAPPAAPSPGESIAADGDAGAATGGGLFVDQSSHSGTTIQEAGVDEADVIKTDGDYVYIIAGERLRIVSVSAPEIMSLTSEIDLEGYGREMYLLDGRVVAITDVYEEEIRGEVLPTDVVAMDSRPVDEESPEFLETDSPDEPVTSIEPAPPDDVLIDPGFNYYPISRPRTLVTIIDIRDRAAPTVISTTKVDGSVASSRMIDGMLHLVIANYQNYYFDIMPFYGRPQFDPAQVDVKSLIPKFNQKRSDGRETQGDLLAYTDLYRPANADGFGIVSVMSLDTNNEASFKAVGIVAEPGLIYSSREALYLTDTNYDYLGNQRTTTDVYKFAYQDGGATPTASGNVQGRILNQYSMSEHNGFLRVATTVDATFGFTGQITSANNNVYVLEQAGDQLTTVGSVENIAPRETIQSARFIGDRGYVVTFEQVDPLFTLDLSDPRNPRIVGELKVPGFSTFIVPMDDNHLLTVGQYIPDQPGDGGFSFRPWGVQLSIFDVTDFANPVQTHNVIIGDETGAYSEAQYNPKAFTYFAERGLLALPINIYDSSPFIFDDVVTIEGDVDVDAGAGTSAGGGSTMGSPGESGEADVESPELEETPLIDEPIVDEPIVVDVPPGDPFAPEVLGGFDGIYVYSVSADGGFTELNRVSTRFDELGYYGSSFARGVFIGENVFAVTDYGVRADRIDSAESSEHELYLGPPYEVTVFDTDYVGVGVDGISAPPEAQER